MISKVVSTLEIWKSNGTVFLSQVNKAQVNRNNDLRLIPVIIVCALQGLFFVHFFFFFFLPMYVTQYIHFHTLY